MMTGPNALDEAAAALAANDMVRLEAICREILRHYPTHPQALHMFTRAVAVQGRGGEALALYNAALEELHARLAPTHVSFGLHHLQGIGFRPRAILDIGAYEGTFAQMARHYFPQAPILMLEAQPGKEAQLKAIAQALPDVTYRIALLGAESRQDVAFSVVDPKVNTSGSSLYDEQTQFPRETISLTMHRLDDVLADMPGRAFDMLKIDVQGAELDVLRGGPQMLAGLEVIVIELSLLEYNKGAPLIGEVTAWLGAHGFALFDMFPVSRLPGGALLQIDGIFLRRDSRLWPAAPFF